MLLKSHCKSEHDFACKLQCKLSSMFNQGKDILKVQLKFKGTVQFTSEHLQLNSSCKI